MPEHAFRLHEIRYFSAKSPFDFNGNATSYSLSTGLILRIRRRIHRPLLKPPGACREKELTRAVLVRQQMQDVMQGFSEIQFRILSQDDHSKQVDQAAQGRVDKKQGVLFSAWLPDRGALCAG